VGVYCILGDEEVDEQIRVRDEMIFQLKQQMATQLLQQRIADLEYELKGQPSQVYIYSRIDYIYILIKMLYLCSHVYVCVHS
jgi:hypothetical protein